MKQVVYTASPESQQIHVWQLNDEGTLTLLQVTDIAGQVQPMVVSPKKISCMWACVRISACWHFVLRRMAP